MNTFCRINITIILLLITSISFAQRHDDTGKEHQERMKQIKSQKISFLTETLDLSPEEAQKFWPIYNEMEKKREENFYASRELKQKIKAQSISTLSEKECEGISRRLAMFPTNEGKILSEYNEKFLEVMPAKKVVKLYWAEDQFRHKLMKKYRGERTGKSNPNKE